MSVRVAASSSRQIGIAGAGLLGRLLAWRLSGLGHRVTVFDPASGPLDRASPMRAAGWTAAGMLSPWAELEGADALVAELGLRSLDRWAEIVARLHMPVHFRRDGSLLLAHRGDLGAAQRLVGLLRHKMPAGLSPQALTVDRLRELEPAVHGPVHAWRLEGEGQIHAVQAMQALAEAATRNGARWRWGEAVHELAPGRIGSERFDAVFDVRGVGARPEMAAYGDGPGVSPQRHGGDPGFTPQVRGVRGEILWLHAPGTVLNRPLRLLHPRSRVYLVPRPGDLIVVGASEIESEDRSPISVRTVLNLLSAAHSVMPELAEARVVHTETNLRPALPDNLPRIDHRPGLVRINGLFRHGWLIAPALVDDAVHEAGLDHALTTTATTMATTTTGSLQEAAA